MSVEMQRYSKEGWIQRVCDSSVFDTDNEAKRRVKKWVSGRCVLKVRVNAHSHGRQRWGGEKVGKWLETCSNEITKKKVLSTRAEKQQWETK